MVQQPATQQTEYPTESRPGSAEAWRFALHAMRCGGPDCEVYRELLDEYIDAIGAPRG